MFRRYIPGRSLFNLSYTCASWLSLRSISLRRKEEIRLLRRRDRDRPDLDRADDNGSQFEKVENAWPCYTYIRGAYLRARYLGDIINDPHLPWLVTSCVYFAVTHFADVRIIRCVVDPNQNVGRSCAATGIFLARRAPSGSISFPCRKEI